MLELTDCCFKGCALFLQVHVELHVTEAAPDDKSNDAVVGDDDWLHEDWVFEDRVSVGFLV